MKIRYMKLIVLALLLVVVAASGYPLAEAQEKVVKVGILAPLTGSVAADAKDYVNGAELAAEEINKSGGILGYNFEVVVADVGEMETDKVKSAFERLVNKDKVDVILTGYASLTNFEIDIARQYQMPYLLSGNCESTYSIIIKNPSAYPTVFSISPSYEILRSGFFTFVEWMTDKGYFPMNKKVAIITSDNPYSRNISEPHRDLFSKRGWTITVYEMIPFGEVLEWGAVLSKIRNDPPSVILIADYLLNNAVTFIDQFLKDPTNSLLLCEYTPQIAEFQEILGARADGVIGEATEWLVDVPGSGLPPASEWLKKFKTKYNYIPGKYGTTLYDSVYIYAEALKKVGDPKKRLEIGNALMQTDYWGNSGHLLIDKNTHMAIQTDEYMPYFNYQLQDRKRIVIYPEAYATGTFKYPYWVKQ